MRFALSCVLLLVAVLATQAEPQYGFDNYYGHPMDSYFRSGLPQAVQPSLDGNKKNAAGRLFFTTVTVTIATTSSTTYITTSTTCTTSTASLKTCSPSGRRRRASLKGGKGLFYEDDGEVDTSIFLPLKNEDVPPQEEPRQKREEADPVTVPYVVQPGFSAPQSAGRFLVAFGTSTTIITSTTTYSATLTANCLSTTGYLVCGSTGK